MNSFKGAEELQKDADEAKKNLTVLKQKLVKQREAIRAQVTQISAAHEKQRQAVAQNEIMKKMDSLEQKLRAHSQTNFQMTEFIAGRRRESEYESLRTEVLSLAADINAVIISQVNAGPKT